MRIAVDNESLTGLTTGVRVAAGGIRAVTVPAPPPCEDVGAADAVGALLEMCGEQLHALAAALSSVALLVDTAQIDYAQAENRAVPRR
jgi:hypothetical protein